MLRKLSEDDVILESTHLGRVRISKSAFESNVMRYDCMAITGDYISVQFPIDDRFASDMDTMALARLHTERYKDIDLTVRD
jgi:hypothetical protein